MSSVVTRRQRLARWLLCAAATGALATGAVLLSEVRPVAADEPTGLQAAVALEGVLTDVIARNEKSLVAIARVKRTGRDSSVEVPSLFGGLREGPMRPGQSGFIPNDYGTGVVLERTGLILTHYSVVGEDSELYVTTVERKTYLAKVKAADPRSDLAVLKIEAQNLEPIKFGDASTLKKGQIVIALGNPYAIAADGQVSASWGIVSNLSRKAGPKPEELNTGAMKETLHRYGTLIQTDAKLNLGTSGGALLNLKGEMIGLTTSMAAAAGYEQSAGYAIPVDATFRRAVDSLKQGREVEYGVLGVRTDQRGEAFTGKQGVVIESIVPGTPAQRFGLLHNDRITHVNGQPIVDADSLVLQIGKLGPDEHVRLTVEREGKVLPILAELTKSPSRGKILTTAAAPGWRGLRVDYRTADPAFFDYQRFETQKADDPQSFASVLIRDVEKDSPAWKEGLRPSMLVTHVENTAVTTPKEFQAAVAGKKGPVKVRLSLPDGDRPVRTIPPVENE